MFIEEPHGNLKGLQLDRKFNKKKSPEFFDFAYSRLEAGKYGIISWSKRLLAVPEILKLR